MAGKPTYEEMKQRVKELEEQTAACKEAENTILQAKQDWERIFDAVPDLIAILDDKHRINRANKAMADRLGVCLDGAVGLTCYEHVHGTKGPPSFCPHAKLLVDGQRHIAEVHEERLGGDFLVSVSPIHDAEGRLIGSVHIAHDITERKRAEEALRKTHDELETRVEERTAELIKANQKLKGEIEDRKLAEEALRESARKQQIAHDQAIIYAQELNEDIAERKRAEEALKESEEKYRTVLEASPDPVVVYDMNGKVVYLNLAFTQVFGWTTAELLGKKIDYVPEEKWPETQMMIDKILSGRSFSAVETRRHTKQGDILCSSCQAKN